MAKPETTERGDQPRKPTLTVNPEGGDDRTPAPPAPRGKKAEARQPEPTPGAEGPRITHPPAGQRVKKAEDGSGRAVYPDANPEAYDWPTPDAGTENG